MSNVFLIASFEIHRLLASRRGWVAVVAYVLVWGMLLYHGVYRVSRILSDSEISVFAGPILGIVGLEQLNQWTVPELALLQGLGLMLLPFFCVMLSADQSTSDRVRGTLRFITMRAARWQVFLGRYAGQLLWLLIFIGLSVLSTLPVVLYRDTQALSDWSVLAPVVMLNLMLIVMPFVALMALVSALASSTRQATLYALILWVVLYVLSAYALERLPAAAFLQWSVPGAQIQAMLATVGPDALTYAPIPLVQSILLLAAGWCVFRYRDL